MMRFQIEYTVVDGEHEYRDMIFVESERSAVANCATYTISNNLSLNMGEETTLVSVIQRAIDANPGDSGQVGCVEIECGMRMLTDFTVNEMIC